MIDTQQRTHRVAVGVIEKNHQILISKRPAGKSHAGLWEFPGGKQNQDEPIEQTLARELFEELDIQVEKFRPLINIRHNYEDFQVCLHVFLVSEWSGNEYGKENQQIHWVERTELHEYSFLTANHYIIRAIELPYTYCVTPDISTFQEEAFLSKIENLILREVKLFQIRDKSKPLSESADLIFESFQLCNQHNASLLLNAKPEILEELPAHGIHLPSHCLSDYSKRPIAKEYLLSVACHNESELDQAEMLAADMALVSPVSMTETHPEQSAIGWERFQALTEQTNIPCYALGGILPSDLEKSWYYGAQGIAMIRGFWE